MTFLKEVKPAPCFSRYLLVRAFLILFCGILFCPFVFSADSTGSSSSAAQSQETKILRLKSRKVVKGKVVFEGPSYYRIATADGQEKVIFKDEISDISVKQEQPPPVVASNDNAANTETDESTPPKNFKEAFKKSLFSILGLEEGRKQGESNLQNWKKVIGDIQSLDKSRPGLGMLAIVLGIVFWLISFLIGLAFHAFITKLSLRMIGVSTTFWRAVLFQFKLWLVTLFLAVLFFIGIAIFVFLISAFPKTVGVVGLIIYIVAAIIVYGSVFVRMYMRNFDLSAGQVILVIVYQIAISLLFTLCLALLGAVVRSLPGFSAGNLKVH